MGANVSADRSQPSSRSSTLTRMSHGYVINDGDVVAREKKKKASKFATLRKKLIRVRRHSRAVDYSKALRELTSTWSIRDLSCLVEEYEAAAILKELAIAANLARPLANSIRQDLSNLFDYKYCTDVDLIYRGACFPAHRALLVARSPFFHDLLSRYQEYGAQVPIKLKTPGVDVPLFSALLRYLYTEEFTLEGSQLENDEIITRLTDEFGMPNPLEQDLRMMLDTGNYSDATLVFTSGSESQENLSSEASSSGDHSSRKHELRCHKAILAARSPFFRNLLLRRARSGEEITERTLQTPTRIVLDESVISRRYARVLLHAIYMDIVDLSLIVRGSTSTCSLSEVQAMVAGRGHITHADEAMEIYQIGQFLDFPFLSQGHTCQFPERPKREITYNAWLEKSKPLWYVGFARSVINISTEIDNLHRESLSNTLWYYPRSKDIQVAENVQILPVDVIGEWDYSNDRKHVFVLRNDKEIQFWFQQYIK